MTYKNELTGDYVKDFRWKVFNRLKNDYPEIDNEFLMKAIVYLTKEPFVIKKEDVESYPSLCARCGVCCDACSQLVFGYKCKVHDSRPKICKDWPAWEVDDESGIHIAPYCEYSILIVYNEFLRRFKN